VTLPPLRVGIVCPFSFDVPGGVQFHVRDLARALEQQGHTVSVLAPADDDTPLPDLVTGAGRAVPVRYNGSVARLALGPVAANRARRWVAGGRFDILHVHEPVNPSLAMMALWIAEGPVVATFHSALTRSRALRMAYPVLRPNLEKISARIAVSEDARRTLVDHLGGDAVVIPNGVFVDQFVDAPTDPRWTGTPQAPTIAFLGRLDEPRKGLPVLTSAIPTVLREFPGARFLVAGGGETGAADARAALGASASAVEFLGSITDAEKAALLRSADVYVAPQTGGESFGIVLVEAMSAGTAVVASDLAAFRRVLDDGRAGVLFRTGDAQGLARTLIQVLGDEDLRRTVTTRATGRVRRYDWETVTQQVLTVYEMVLSGVGPRTPVGEDPNSLRTRWGGRRVER
jgi:phosphatidyl-myo-inositol alpha-mannosyltransferase